MTDKETLEEMLKLRNIDHYLDDTNIILDSTLGASIEFDEEGNLVSIGAYFS